MFSLVSFIGSAGLNETTIILSADYIFFLFTSFYLFIRGLFSLEKFMEIKMQNSKKMKTKRKKNKWKMKKKTKRKTRRSRREKLV